MRTAGRGPSRVEWRGRSGDGVWWLAREGSGGSIGWWRNGAGQSRRPCGDQETGPRRRALALVKRPEGVRDRRWFGWWREEESWRWLGLEATVARQLPTRQATVIGKMGAEESRGWHAAVALTEEGWPALCGFHRGEQG